MNIDNMRTILLCILGATFAGLVSFLVLRRLGGIESGPIKRPERNRGNAARLDEITNKVVRYVPMSEKVANSTRDMLSRSGLTMAPATFWALRVIALCIGLTIGLIIMPIIGGIQGLAAVAAGGIAGLVAPQAWLLSKRKEWQDELDRQLPDALDLMSICIGAGSSFEGALSLVGQRMDGAIAEAFARVAKEAAYSSRSEALLSLSERAQVNSITFFVASLVQAERAGSSLVDIIQQQAKSVRTERRLRVDEITNKLSTKMLFPMILLMLPSLIILMLAPMAIQLVSAFG